MTVNQYLYQSPSSSSVQVGRLDPSTKKEDTSSQSSSSAPNTNETQQRAESFAATQTKEVTPTVSADTQLLDIYV